MPTAEPSFLPTAMPTSPVPTALPTLRPTTYKPTPEPSGKPTAMPTDPPGDPTPRPSARPTQPSPAPTSIPTLSPTKRGFCQLYTAQNTNSDVVNMPTCGVTASAGQTFTVSMCSAIFAGTYCMGKTTLRVYDSRGVEVVYDDTGTADLPPAVCMIGDDVCAQVQFTVPANTPSQTYVIKEGCVGGLKCEGRAVVTGAPGVQLVTFGPTPRPSPFPTVAPSPQPTTKPSPIPSTLPTPQPSGKPTVPPSPAPSTAKPSSKPTVLPTGAPSPRPTTRHPTFSNQTGVPSFKPTLSPTYSANIAPVSLSEGSNDLENIPSALFGGMNAKIGAAISISVFATGAGGNGTLTFELQFQSHTGPGHFISSDLPRPHAHALPHAHAHAHAQSADERTTGTKKTGTRVLEEGDFVTILIASDVKVPNLCPAPGAEATPPPLVNVVTDYPIPPQASGVPVSVIVTLSGGSGEAHCQAPGGSGDAHFNLAYIATLSVLKPTLAPTLAPTTTVAPTAGSSSGAGSGASPPSNAGNNSSISQSSSADTAASASGNGGVIAGAVVGVLLMLALIFAGYYYGWKAHRDLLAAKKHSRGDQGGDHTHLGGSNFDATFAAHSDYLHGDSGRASSSTGGYDVEMSAFGPRTGGGVVSDLGVGGSGTNGSSSDAAKPALPTKLQGYYASTALAAGITPLRRESMRTLGPVGPEGRRISMNMNAQSTSAWGDNSNRGGAPDEVNLYGRDSGALGMSNPMFEATFEGQIQGDVDHPLNRPRQSFSDASAAELEVYADDLGVVGVVGGGAANNPMHAGTSPGKGSGSPLRASILQVDPENDPTQWAAFKTPAGTPYWYNAALDRTAYTEPACLQINMSSL